MKKIDIFKTMRTQLNSSNWCSIYKGYRFKNKYAVQRKISTNGSQAELYLCCYNQNYYIAKLYREGMEFDEHILYKLRCIKSDCIVPIVDEGSLCNQRFEIMPYYENGDLAQYGAMSYEDIKDVFIPFMNKALRIIHDVGIIHMDIKPSNIFVDKEGGLHLGDFGIASLLNDVSINTTRAKGSLGYRPPESYTDINIKSPQFDAYGFGISIIHLWCGYPPYKNESEMRIIKKTLDGQIPIPNDMPHDIKNLVIGLTAYDKKIRWNYENVLNWIEGVDTYDRNAGYELIFYEFKIITLKDFAHAISSSENHWNEALYRFKYGLFEEYFRSKSDDIYAVYKYAVDIKS